MTRKNLLLICLSLTVIVWLSCFCLIRPVAAVEKNPIQTGTVLLALTETSDPADIRLCEEQGPPIDLNNANVVAFTDCPGFYPRLATLILAHGPYETVEEVLTIPGLTLQQRTLLQANLEHFTITEAIVPLEQRMPPRPPMPAK